MNLILEKALSWLGIKAAPQATDGYRRTADWFFPEWPSQQCIVPNPGGCYQPSSLVAAAVNFMGTVLSGSPCEVYQRDGDEYQIIHDHPMSQLLAEPNPYHSGALFWKTFAHYWITNGNVFFYKVRNGSGQVIQLWLLQSDRVAVRSTNGEFISWYEYSPPASGEVQRIEQEDMVHFRYSLNPIDHRLGISPLVSLASELATDAQGEFYSKTALSNAGVPPYIVSPKVQGDNYIKFDAEQLKATIETATGGFNRGRPLVISKPTDIKEFGFSPQQMDTKALRRVPEERVASVLGIPAIVLGFGVGLEHATYANFRTAERAGWTNSVIPTQRQIAADLYVHLLPEFERNTAGLWVEFDNSEVDALKENVNDETAREISLWVNGVKKRSEVRSEFDLDTGPDDDQFLIEPGSRPVQQPGGMNEAIRSTMRQPTLTMPAPGVDKAFGLRGNEPTGAELDALDAWFKAVAPDDAQGVLDAVSIP